MSLFDLDCVVSFEEYKRMIYHHAENFNVRSTAPETTMQIAQRVFAKAKASMATKQFDHAFYYFVRCLYIIECTGLRKKLAASKELVQGCLDDIDLLVKGGLSTQYNDRMSAIQEREEERKRIVKLQLEPGVDIDITDQFRAHESRRAELLAVENARVEAIRTQLLEKGTATPSVNGTSTTATSILIPTPTPAGESNAPAPSTAIQPSTAETPSVIAPSCATRDRLFFRPMSAEPASCYRAWIFNGQRGVRSDVPHTPRRGMVNLGNTCYLNSVTQVLSTTPVGRYFLSNVYINDIVDGVKGNGRLANTFAYVIRELHRVNCLTPVSPSPLKRAFGEAFSSFNNYSQQDANEFLRNLLDGIHSNINLNAGVKAEYKEIDTKNGSDADIALLSWRQYVVSNKSEIVRLCAFQERSTLRCPNCQKMSRSFSILMGADVPIPLKSTSVCIEDCLKMYCAEEMLDATSLYTCTFCSQKVRATKQLSFYSAPEVLFVTMKRFRSYGDFANKVTTAVYFQQTLDLGPFMCTPQQGGATYKLVGIVNHQGNIHGGHYTADCLGDDEYWFSYSDERVVEGARPDFNLAYILCYTRVR